MLVTKLKYTLRRIGVFVALYKILNLATNAILMIPDFIALVQPYCGNILTILTMDILIPGNSDPSLPRVSCTGRGRCSNKRLQCACRYANRFS